MKLEFKDSTFFLIGFIQIKKNARKSSFICFPLTIKNSVNKLFY